LYVRGLSEFGWLKGKTENISRTGVLFRFERPMQVGKSVEMNFAPPAEVWGGTPGTIYCRGKVVRSSPPVPPTRQSTVAAKILNYYGGRTQQDW
jgi:hypothetical protein